jgi:hypothetical protein
VSPGVTERAEQIVAELAANAALHGRVNGRDFRLTLTLDTTAGLLRIAVIDARGEHLPSLPAECGTPLGAESGRGLVLVTALADRWGVEPYPPGGKTVWAECACEAPGPDTHSGRLNRDGWGVGVGQGRDETVCAGAASLGGADSDLAGDDAHRNGSEPRQVGAVGKTPQNRQPEWETWDLTT